MSAAGRLQEEAFAWYLREAGRTSTVRWDGVPAGPAMVALWHEWTLTALAGVTGASNIAVYMWHQPGLASMRRIVRKLGHAAIVARPDNAFGVRELREWLRGPNHVVAITLDGPNGPRRKAKTGVVRLARSAQVPLHPLVVCGRAAFTLTGWDQRVVPPCGGEIVLRVCPQVPETDSVEEATERMAQVLNDDPLEIASPKPGGFGGLASRALARASTMPLRYGTVTLGDTR